ncbi:hypothetical protein WAI453_013546 [Rhynchosporium graminicola]
MYSPTSLSELYKMAQDLLNPFIQNIEFTDRGGRGRPKWWMMDLKADLLVLDEQSNNGSRKYETITLSARERSKKELKQLLAWEMLRLIQERNETARENKTGGNLEVTAKNALAEETQIDQTNSEQKSSAIEETVKHQTVTKALNKLDFELGISSRDHVSELYKESQRRGRRVIKEVIFSDLSANTNFYSLQLSASLLVSPDILVDDYETITFLRSGESKKDIKQLLAGDMLEIVRERKEKGEEWILELWKKLPTNQRYPRPFHEETQEHQTLSDDEIDLIDFEEPACDTTIALNNATTMLKTLEPFLEDGWEAQEQCLDMYEPYMKENFDSSLI